MIKYILLFVIAATWLACKEKKEDQQTTLADTTTKVNDVVPTKVNDEPTNPDLPGYVVFRNWAQGNPMNSKIVVDVYEAWDNNNTTLLATYFEDSAVYDFPDGRRRMTTNKTIEKLFQKWRHAYKETSNIPFSLISLYNKDFDQEWVIAWTWNKWRSADGKKDSMLYCDNWRISKGRITYLNSLENLPSRALSKKLNEGVPGKTAD